MYEHILIPSDGSELSNIGVDQGLALARQHGCRVTAVTVTEPFGGQFAFASDLWAPSETELAAYNAEQSLIAGRILAQVRAKAAALGLKAETVHVPGRLASRAIVSLSEELGCDLIVMSSHGRTGVTRAMLGSQTAAVAAASRAPVLVAK